MVNDRLYDMPDISSVHQSKKDKPKAVIGMFDVSARPFVQENILSFAVPMKRFEVMISFMEESFLSTNSWGKVKKRINK